jgi:hypothetical protein
LVADYEDGVWLVELAGLQDPELVPRAVLTAFGFMEQPRKGPTESQFCDPSLPGRRKGGGPRTRYPCLAWIRTGIDSKLIGAGQETKKILLLARLQYMVAVAIRVPIVRPVQSVYQEYREAAGITAAQIENQMTTRQRKGSGRLFAAARDAYRSRQSRRTRALGACWRG